MELLEVIGTEQVVLYNQELQEMALTRRVGHFEIV